MDTEGAPVPLPPSPMSPDPQVPGVDDDARLSWWATPLLMSVCLLPGLVTIGLQHVARMWVVHSSIPRAPWELLGHFAREQAWDGLRLGVGIVAAEWLAPATWRRPVRWAIGLGVASLVPPWGCPWLRYLSPPLVPAPGPVVDLWPIGSLTQRGLYAFGWALYGWCCARLLVVSGNPWRGLPLVGAATRLVAVVPLLGLEWVYVRALLSAPRWTLVWNLWLYWGVALAVVALTGCLLGLALAAGLRLGRSRGEWTVLATLRRLRQRLGAELQRIFS